MMTQIAVQLNTESEVLIQDVQYEFIRVKLLDCRSGEAISNSRVKRLVIKKGTNTVVNVEFKRADKLIEGTDGVRNSLKALKKLGFAETELPSYNTAAITAFNSYWENRAPGEVAVLTTANPSPTENYYILLTKEYNSHYQTDSEGILNLRIPQNFFDGNEVSIEVGFWDVPIFLEEIGGDTRTNPVRRNKVDHPTLRMPDPEAPQFKIVWNTNGQNDEWNGTWGWEAQKDVMRVPVHAASEVPSWFSPFTNLFLRRGTLPFTYGYNVLPEAAQPSASSTEFKVSEIIVIKNSTATFNNDSTLENDFSSIMSVFFNNSEANCPHFVLFGMQWCQPVWDGIEDNPNGEVGAISERSYIQHADYHGMNMHLATRYNDLGGSDLNGGKGYGKMEACTSGWATKYRSSSGGGYPGHSGFDIYLPINQPVFAFRAGKATAEDDSNHYKESLTWEAIAPDATNSIKFLHLSNGGRIANEFVMTGQIIGRAGRSGNLGWTSDWPGHTHINVGSYPNDPINSKHYTSRLYETNYDHVDEWNLSVFPSNNLPLVLPCKCQIGNIAQTGTFFTCNFDNSYAKSCWAAMELKCPQMLSKSNAITDAQGVRMIQAQLKYLGYFVGANKLLDNVNGNLLKSAIVKYKSNNTNNLQVANSNTPVDNSERAAHFVTAGDVDNTITDLLCTWLNTEAPIPTSL